MTQVIFEAVGNTPQVLDASGLPLSDFAVLRGGSGNDTLIGSRGNDRLDGRGGNDSMAGGDGDDRFFVDYSLTQVGRDSISGGLGTDMIVYQVATSLMTTAIKAELVRLSLYAAAGDFSSNFVSDVLRLDVTDVDAVLLRVDGTVQTVADIVGGPVATADSYAAVEDTPLAVGAAQGLLANDAGEAGGLRAVAGTFATALGGSVTIAADGSFTYTPAANANGADSFGYTLADILGRTTAGTVTLSVAAVNDAASIGGTGTGSVAEDGTLAASGQLTITDPDAGEAAFRTPASLAGTYGTFTFDAATGAWSYALDNAAANVQALTAGQVVTDTLTVTSLDGSATRDIVVSIAGAVEPVRLADIAAGTGGFKILGETDSDSAGLSVSAAGDVDGDGKADLLVGAYEHSSDGTSYNGAAYLVFGRAGTATIDLDDVAAGTGSLGVKILGEAYFDRAGLSVSGAGDVNGDGRPDLLIGAQLADSGGTSDNGVVYVVFGQAGGGTIDLDDIATGTSTLGFKIQGEAGGDWAGYSVSAAGDLDGDGLADLVIGAPRHDSGGMSNNGAAYVVFGKATGGTIDLADIATGTSTLGFKILGEAGGDWAGYSVSAAGDVNGDGRPDLIIGVPYDDSDGATDNGAAYVVFGKASGGAIDLADIATGTSTLGFKILGEAGDDYAGIAVSAIGDLDGDGLADLVVGAYSQVGAGGAATGGAYVVFGKTTGGTIDLDDIATGTSTLGFKIQGEAGGDWAAYSVSAAGDVNGDGRPDLLVGTWADSSEGNTANGAAYLVFGRAGGGTIDLDQIAAGTSSLGVKILGEASYDYAGWSVAAAGDVDADGLADLLVGAYGNSSDGALDNGAAYVIHGRAEWLAPLRITGTTTGAVQEDGTTTASGTLSLAGSAAAGAAFATPASLAGTYGNFTFDAATGAWSYALANSQANVQALNTGQMVTDTLRIATTDGAALAAVAVSIAGANEQAAPVTLGFDFLGPRHFDVFTVTPSGGINPVFADDALLALLPRNPFFYRFNDFAFS